MFLLPTIPGTDILAIIKGNSGITCLQISGRNISPGQKDISIITGPLSKQLIILNLSGQAIAGRMSIRHAAML
jgi:hypothetical protein